MVPFLVLCLVYLFKELNQEKLLRPWFNWVYMGIVLLLFILFYPVLSGMIIDKGYVRDMLRWFGTWYFYS
ncbi:hypothetical protein D3C87_2078830 [compost metagenome]